MSDMRIAGDVLKSPEGISVYYGIKWIASKGRREDQIMKRVYRNRARGKHREFKRVSSTYPIAELMRRRMPSVTKEMLSGRAKDVKIIHGKVLLIATPPRLYSEWGHEFLKSDICLIGPRSEESELLKEFKQEKAESLEEKKNVFRYIEAARPSLDELFDEGTISGVLGRGSYFGKNGFPGKWDDINFILFAKNGSAKTESRIMDVLKRIPRFSVVVIHKHEEAVKKEGRSPSLSFIIVFAEMVKTAKFTRYEEYVLKDGVGIGLKRLKKEESEAMARKFMRLLPRPSKR